MSSRPWLLWAALALPAAANRTPASPSSSMTGSGSATSRTARPTGSAGSLTERTQSVPKTAVRAGCTGTNSAPTRSAQAGNCRVMPVRSRPPVPEAPTTATDRGRKKRSRSGTAAYGSRPLTSRSPGTAACPWTPAGGLPAGVHAGAQTGGEGAVSRSRHRCASPFRAGRVLEKRLGVQSGHRTDDRSGMGRRSGSAKTPPGRGLRRRGRAVSAREPSTCRASRTPASPASPAPTPPASPTHPAPASPASASAACARSAARSAPRPAPALSASR